MEDYEANQIDIEEVGDMFAYDDRNEQKMLNELLFCVQGVGSIKNVNGINVFVKGLH